VRVPALSFESAAVQEWGSGQQMGIMWAYPARKAAPVGASLALNTLHRPCTRGQRHGKRDPCGPAPATRRRPAARLPGAQQHPHNVMSAHFGRYRDFGLYTDSLAFYGSRMFYYVWDLPIFFTMGAIGGLMGALWVHVNVKITALRHRRINFRRARRAGSAAVACERGQAGGQRAGAPSKGSFTVSCAGLPEVACLSLNLSQMSEVIVRQASSGVVALRS
jgi:hypothetical protein